MQDIRPTRRLMDYGFDAYREFCHRSDVKTRRPRTSMRYARVHKQYNYAAHVTFCLIGLSSINQLISQ